MILHKLIYQKVFYKIFYAIIFYKNIKDSGDLFSTFMAYCLVVMVALPTEFEIATNTI